MLCRRTGLAALAVFGAEAEVKASVKPVDFRLAYGFINARYASTGPYSGKQQFEVPPHMGKADLTLRLAPGLNRVELSVEEPAEPAPRPGEPVLLLEFLNWQLDRDNGSESRSQSQ